MWVMTRALGWGEGGEQNAPLGRAVIGGLFTATFATLFFVPVVYSILRRQQPRNLEEDDMGADKQFTTVTARSRPE